MKQPPPFLAKGSAYRAAILGSQQAKPKAVTFSKPVEIKQQPLRPRVLLPDTCLYCTWVNGRLTETSTRDFEGAVAIRPEWRVSQKLVLALDYHQVLDRSRTETAWAVQRVPRENFELIRKLKADLGDRLIICVCSHIERSEKNLRDLIRCLHNTDGVQDLTEFVTITTQRTGALGKLSTLAAICRSRALSLTTTLKWSRSAAKEYLRSTWNWGGNLRLHVLIELETFLRSVKGLWRRFSTRRLSREVEKCRHLIHEWKKAQNQWIDQDLPPKRGILKQLAIESLPKGHPSVTHHHQKVGDKMFKGPHKWYRPIRQADSRWNFVSVCKGFQWAVSD